MSGYDLPWLNAGLNSAATVLLILGYVAIRTGHVRLHKGLMLTALTTSAVFLTSYLTYHLGVRGGESTQYNGEYRIGYLGLLLSHTILAALVAPLAIITARLGIAGKFPKHRRIARVTLPIWLYVSVTGVILFSVLKDLYPRN